MTDRGESNGNTVSEMLRGVENIGIKLIEVLEKITEIQRGSVQFSTAREKERKIRDDQWRETVSRLVERAMGELKVKLFNLKTQFNYLRHKVISPPARSSETHPARILSCYYPYSVSD